jgi:Amt family ammonium transporter
MFGLSLQPCESAGHNKMKLWIIAPLVLLSAYSTAAFGADTPAVSTRSLPHAEVLLLAISGALVFFMQAGFAFLESGMARAKNSVNVMLKNYLDMCYGAVIFWAVGFALMFGNNPSGWFGTSQFLFSGARTVDFVFFFYQVMFAATAATIVSGAVAERTHFKGYIIGSMIITGLIYPVYGSWVWGGWNGGEGWLAKLGFIDFAGSTVVHSVGGWCALAALIIIKPRLGRYAPDGTARNIPGHNMSSAVLGALILWLGWFGFNGGSAALLPNGSADVLGRVVMNTHLGGAAGALGAALAMWIFRNKILLTVTLNGGVGGLVSVTAGAHVMDPAFAIVTGLMAGLLISIAEALFVHWKIDDVVGAVAVHLVGGIWGTIAAGLFNPATFFSGKQLLIQLTGIGAAAVWAFGLALLMYWVLDKTIGMRATPLQEQRGLDFSEHAEIAYPEFQRDVVHGGNKS